MLTLRVAVVLYFGPVLPPLSAHQRISATSPRLHRQLHLPFRLSSHLTSMAKKRKNRTHLKGGAASGAPSADTSGVPKSFVIKHGQVGSSLAQLVRDVRKVMEPHTASRLRVRLIPMTSCDLCLTEYRK